MASLACVHLISGFQRCQWGTSTMCECARLLKNWIFSPDTNGWMCMVLSQFSTSLAFAHELLSTSWSKDTASRHLFQVYPEFNLQNCISYYRLAGTHNPSKHFTTHNTRLLQLLVGFSRNNSKLLVESSWGLVRVLKKWQTLLIPSH